MLDLDSIVADEAVENDLEEVVMGLSSTPDRPAAWPMPH